jgi:CIC family chloride channel protein
MAAFFTASVNAPVTGLILATEMTGDTNQLPPMLGACAVAMLVAIALRSQSIYDRLAERAADHGPQHLSEA